MLPRVNFCGLEITRLIIGANPFGGFSHQSPERDRAMFAYHTSERILETWRRAEEAGINTMVTNNETPHIIESVRKYIGSGGRLQWIAQVADPENNMFEAVDRAVKIGAKAVFFQGGLIDRLFAERDEVQQHAARHPRSDERPEPVEPEEGRQPQRHPHVQPDERRGRAFSGNA